MKSNAPEKIWMDLEWIPHFDSKECITENSIEYIRADAFIEKACEYIKEHLFDYWSQSVTNENKFIKDFINYIKGK